MAVEARTTDIGGVAFESGTGAPGSPYSGILASVSSVTPGTAAASLGKAEDAAHTSGDVGVMMLGVANVANAALANTAGDYTPINTDLEGRVSTLGGAFSSKVSFTAVGGAYGAGDVVAAATQALLELANCFSKAGAKSLITDVKVTVPTGSITARPRVHLYETNTKTATADNAAYAITTTENSGARHIPMQGLSALSSGITESAAEVSRVMAGVGTSLFAEISFDDAVTLDSGESLFLEVAGIYLS